MIVNICCSESSGSTLFSHVLDRHPEIACGDELKLFSILMAYKNYREFVEGSSTISKLGVTSNPYRGKSLTLKNLSSYGLSERTAWAWVRQSNNIQELAEKFETHVQNTTGKPIWAEKNPSNIRLSGFFREAFPSEKIVHLARDPRDVVLSLINRGYTVYEAADHWLASVAALQSIRGSDNLLEITYEDLLLRKEKTLKQLCDFLDIDFQMIFFTEDTFASKTLSQFGGFDSWNSAPQEGFSLRSIGKYRSIEYDLSPIYSLQLTRSYARLLGVERYRLGELAESYGYDIPGTKRETGSRIPVYGKGYKDMLGKEEQWKSIEKKLRSASRGNRRAVYGAGEHTERLLEFFLEDIGYEIAFVVDKNPDLWEGEIRGLPIYPPGKLKEENIDTVIISSFEYESEIENYLKEVLQYKGKVIGLYDRRKDFFPFYMNLAHEYETEEYMVKTLL